MRRWSLPVSFVHTLVVGTLAGCATTPEGLPAPSAAGRAGGSTDPARIAKEIGSGVFGAPLVLDGTHLVLVPFSVVRPESKSKGYADFLSGLSLSSSSSSGASYSVSGSKSGFYRQTSGAHWNNVLLYDKRTGDARLLLDRRAVVVQAFFPKPTAPGVPQASPHPVPPHLLLAVAEADTSGDRYINGDDVTVLHHVNLADLSLTPLTPADARFSDFTPDEGARVLYVRSVTDGNADRQFTADDDAVIARVDLTSPAPGTPVVPDELRRRAFSVATGEGQ